MHLSHSEIEVGKVGSRLGRLKALLAAVFPNLPNLPNLSLTHMHMQVRARARAHACVYLSNKLGRLGRLGSGNKDAAFEVPYLGSRWGRWGT